MKCKAEGCNQTYIGETGRRLVVRAEEHGGKSETSNVTRHSITAGHKPVALSDFKILTHLPSSNINSRKIAEALLIKKYKPSLNVQGASVNLELF